jgi:hypothetical protein
VGAPSRYVDRRRNFDDRSPSIGQIRLVLEDHGIPYADNSVNRETWQQDKMVYENFPFNQGLCCVGVLV